MSYGTSFTYRGNVTQTSTPGKTIYTYYDATGTVTSQGDGSGHSVTVATSSLTNFTLPDTLTHNGTASLQTQAAYNLPNFLPTSVAGPSQTLNNGTKWDYRHGGRHCLRQLRARLVYPGAFPSGRPVRRTNQLHL